MFILENLLISDNFVYLGRDLVPQLPIKFIIN